MAIQKKVGQTKITNNTAESLCKFPEPANNNTIFEHCPCPPKHDIIIYESFEEAAEKCQQIYLRPGETHTEFYTVTENGKTVYHCVIAIGNANDGKGHLFLTDTGKTGSISDQISKISALLDKDTLKIAQIEEQIKEFTSEISTINSSIADINTSLDDIYLTLNEIQKLNEELSNRLSILESMQLDSSIADINASIAELKSITDTSIISDSSIDSLFSDDIYTVNLCCVTRGGHIEIRDNKEPFNVYKTYVEGDEVSFEGVPNLGYRLKVWYKDAKEIVDNPTVNTSFNEDTIDQNSLGINVIGTLNDGFERDILTNGYTAIFEKLHKFDVRITYTNKNVTELSGDDVILLGDIYDVSNKYALDHGTVDASVVTINHHTFNYLMIDGSTKTEKDYYRFEPVLTDHFIEAVFTENRYYFTTDSRHIEYGSTQHIPDHIVDINGEYLEGTQIKCIARPEDGYHFVKWELQDKEENYSEENPVTITVDSSLNGTLIAHFEENIPNVTFIIENGSMYIKQQN